MDEVAKNQTQKQLTSAKNILVAVSSQSGFDGQAAGLALFLSLKKLGKNVSAVAPQPKVADALKLYGVDKIGEISASKNLVIVIDNAIETVDKVTYFLEGTKLKIVVHALKDSTGPTQKAITFENTFSEPNIVFAIGFTSIDELKNEITHEQNINPETWVININNRPVNQKFAHVNLDSADFASLSEKTCYLIQNLGLPIDQDIAFNLYSGIADATGMFSLKLTKPSTLEMAQYLLKFGAGDANLAQVSLKKDIYETSANQPQIVSQNAFSTSIPHNLTPSFEKPQTPIEEVETKDKSKESWLKPPKIYRGSKSFDRES